MNGSPIVAGYTRISRVGGRKGDGFISEADQREGILRRAGELGLTVAEWFHDPDYSGGNLQRPEWERLMGRILDPSDSVSGVIVVRVDRFARTVPEGAPEVQRIWNAGGVFVAADLPVDTTTDHGRKMLWDWLSNAEFQLGMLKSGWTRAKGRAIKRGAHIGRTPFGYGRVPKGEDGSGRLYPLPDQADAVRAAFCARRDGASYSAVAATLDERAPKATRWTVTDVKRMLRARVYLGEVRYGDGLVNRDAHDPIIDAGLFAAVQPTHRTGERKRADTPFLLSGLVRCAHCRYAMGGFSRGGSKRDTPVYRCISRGNRCDHRPLITASALEEYVVSIWRDFATLELGRSAETVDVDLSALDTEADALAGEVDEWIADATLKTRIGAARWQVGLDARLEAAEAKDRERAEAYARSASSGARYDLDPNTQDRDEIRAQLPVIVKHVFVRSGRGLPAERRAAIVMADGPDFETPRRGVAGPFDPLPWAQDDRPTVLSA